MFEFPVIGRELSSQGLINVDWTLFNCVNDQIAVEESVFELADMENAQKAGFLVVREISMINFYNKFLIAKNIETKVIFY